MEHAPEDSVAGADDAVDHQRPAFEAEQQRELDEAVRVLMEQGHHGLVQRIFQLLDQRQYHEAMRVLNEDDDQEHDGGWTAWADPTLAEFRARLADKVRLILNAGYDEHETFHVFHQLVLVAARETAGLFLNDYEDHVPHTHYDYSDGGFGAVPAPAAAVARLEKRTFHAGGGVTEDCSICFEAFVDGAEVSVMPCPSRGHEFHTGCIAKWLGISNMCPLCRHGLGSSNASAAPSSSMVAEPDHVVVVEQQVPQDGPPMVVVERRSTRRRRPNVRTSGSEWVRA
ncbi:unnamed protein product [Urochloa humidicola]